MFPIYLIVVVGLLAILIGGCMWYVQFYKRKINEALDGAQKNRKAMPTPFNVAIMLLISFLVFAVFMSFVIGFGMGYRSFDEKVEGQIDVTAFYAEIISIDENAVTVKGIALNEKEYRQEVTFQLHESVIIEWNDQPLTIANLEEGDLVSIILIEDVLGVEDIFKIQLLEG